MDGCIQVSGANVIGKAPCRFSTLVQLYKTPLRLLCVDWSRQKINSAEKGW